MRSLLPPAGGVFHLESSVVDGTTALINQRRFATAVFASRHDVQPRSYEVTWDELAEALLGHRVYASKHEAWLWSPTLYREGATRGREGIQAITLLVADIDDGTTPVQLHEWLQAAGTAYLIASTWSHTLETPHLRVIIPLLLPIPATEYSDVWRRANQHVFRSHIDPSTKDASRLYYAPGCPFERQHLVLTERFDDAPPLDWRTLPAIVEPPRPTTFTPDLSGVVTADSEYRARCFLVKWHADLASMAPETGRHNALLSKAVAAGGLIASGVLSESEAYAALMSACESNGLLSDPGGAAEKTVRDGLAYGATMPWRPDDLPDSPTWRARIEAPRMGQDTVRSEPKTEQMSKPERVGFVFTTLEDLLAEPPEEVAYVVEGLLPTGGVSLWGAKPKVGKSVAVRNLAIAVARGETFLERACHRGVVLLLALEEKRAEVANHFRTLGGTDELIHIHVGAAPATSKEGLAVLANAVALYQPVLVIADPVLKLIRVRDSSDYAELTRELEPVIELARTSGCHIAVAHHLGKQLREGGDDVLGSTAIFGAVDTLVLFRRRKDNQRVLQTIQRYGSDLAETLIPMDVETGRIALGVELSEVRVQEAREAVLDLLGKLETGERLDQKAVREQAGVQSALAYRALQDLVNDGRVDRSGSGKRNDAFQYCVTEKSQEKGCSLVLPIYVREQETNKTSNPDGGEERLL